MREFLAKQLYVLKDANGKVLGVGTLKQLRRRFKANFGHLSKNMIKLATEQAGFVALTEPLPQKSNQTTHESNLKKKARAFPKAPGVYKFLDEQGNVIYVGKAKSLKDRILQYFGADTRPQLPYLKAEATDLDYIVTRTELESLFLENSLIKEYLPKYNIKLRDDKNYAFIKIDYTSQIPQITYTRKIEDKRSTYFGPYTSAYKIRQTLDLVRRIFPYCTNKEIGKRPCFYYYLHRCPGVCFGKISLEDYKKELAHIATFLSGHTFGIQKDLAFSMQEFSKARAYEAAARIRDQLKGLEMLNQKQITQFAKRVDWDFVSVVTLSDLACVNLFKVREGKLRDKENFIFDKLSFLDTTKTALESDVLTRFLESYYSETTDFPQSIFLQTATPNSTLVTELISNRSGKPTSVSVPLAGDKKKLIKLGKTNALEYLQKWEVNQAARRDALENALHELQLILELPTLPKRIEGYDISNIQGTNPVGSMVVMKDGLPAKSEYRKFKIKTKNTPDDFAMMREMLMRRTEHLPKKVKNGVTAWEAPDLFVIDGGKGQLSIATEVFTEKNITIPVIGLAKRIEEIFLPGTNEPILLDHTHPSLQLLQRLRDEAHRFAITFHRSLRSKAAVKSALDDIPGIGPKTKKLLKQKIGSITEIKNTPLETLAALVGKQKAEMLKKYLS